jgi:serine/threonine protein kinase
MGYVAIELDSQIYHVDNDFSPEFDRWLELKRSNHRVDFRRIKRMGFGFRCLRDFVVNLSEFEERSMINECDGIQNEIYHRVEDEFIVFVKSIGHWESVNESQMANELENLIRLQHPCIAGPIGFVFGIASSSRQELKILRLYLESCSLREVLSVRPVWWTSTIKAKVVAGIVLGLQFAHSFGLLHGSLTTNNILFDEDHCIQIADFGPIRLEGAGIGGFSGPEWTPKVDIHAFRSLLSEIVSASGVYETAVSQIIEEGMETKSKVVNSFCDIFRILREYNFDILPGVHFEEVSAYVDEIESRE